MATGTADKAVDMSKWDFLDSDSALFNPGKTVITETDESSGEVVHYYGTFMGEASEPYVSVTGGTMTGTDFFIDGVRQFNITGLNADALTVYNFLTGSTPTRGVDFIAYLFRNADTLNGSEFADTINGFAGADTLKGNGGNDKLNGGTGVDHVNGGAGNDTMTWGAGDFFNGGIGADTLKVAAGNLNLTTIANNMVLNTEQIDLRAGNHTLTLTANDVLALSSTTDSIKILGDAGDHVDLPGTPGHTAGPTGFVTYNLAGGAHLLIDADIHVV